MKKIIENGWLICGVMFGIALIDLWTLPGLDISGGFIVAFAFGTYMIIREFKK